MTDKHPHAAMLDRIGKAKVHTLYNIKDRTWREWRQKGVPRMYWNGLRNLALVNGLTSQELDA